MEARDELLNQHFFINDQMTVPATPDLSIICLPQIVLGRLLVGWWWVVSSSGPGALVHTLSGKWGLTSPPNNIALFTNFIAPLG